MISILRKITKDGVVNLGGKRVKETGFVGVDTLREGLPGRSQNRRLSRYGPAKSSRNTTLEGD
jgi:hypothetical protein